MNSYMFFVKGFVPQAAAYYDNYNQSKFYFQTESSDLNKIEDEIKSHGFIPVRIEKVENEKV